MKSWKKPTPEQVEKAVALLGQRQHYRYFFDRLENPKWLLPLKEKGFFCHPSAIVRDEEKGTIGFPPWPESAYLARMANEDPNTVLEIAVEIETDNVEVHEDLAEAALAMPPELAARWAKKETEWLRNQEHLYLPLLPDKLGALVAHLARGGQVNVALDLARNLLSLFPDPRAQERVQKDGTRLLSPEPRAWFAAWTYGAILEKVVPALLDSAGEETFKLVCDLLEKAIRLSQASPEDKGPQDYSYAFRPAIEKQTRNRSFQRLEDLLISAVRDAAENLVKLNRATVQKLVLDLEKRPWRIFHRIAVHLLRTFSDAAPDLVAERLTSREYFNEFGLRHEYALLAKECFGQLSAGEQETILSWIEEGPDLEGLDSPERAQHYKRAWQRDRLAPLQGKLPGQWQERYQELVAELGPPKFHEFVAFVSSGWVGPTSPKTAEELRQASIAEIAAFLNSWQPPKEWDSPSPEGLGRILAEVVAKDPGRFADASPRFMNLDPTYVRALLSGLRAAAKAKKSFAWEPVLDLCCWIVQQPREIPGRRVEHHESDPDWGWARKEIAGLLSEGFEEGAVVIPLELRTKVWEILNPLTDDPEPTVEYERRYGGPTMDPATLSINTTRGEAMHAVVKYALWVRRHLEALPDGKQRVAYGFKEMPEVRQVLDAHLDPERDQALAIRSVYGMYFPWLVLLDPDWAKASVSRIFPQTEGSRELRDAAWETYIAFCDCYNNVFEVLRDEYFRAVDRIGSHSSAHRYPTDPENSLAEHLMILYLQGKLDLEGPDDLLKRFYEKAPDARRAHAMGVIGTLLQRSSRATVPEQLVQRLRILWEHRLTVARSAERPASHTAEIAGFGSWFASGALDDAWALAQLEEALELAGKVEPDHLVVGRLAAIAEDYAAEAVKCLSLIVKGDKVGWDIYGWQEEARLILAAALRSSNPEAREAGEDLVHILGARGHLEFRDLLGKLR